MAEAITRFNSELATTIIDLREAPPYARLDFMNSVTEHILDFGGYCDDLTFSTAFFGDVDPATEWRERTMSKATTATSVPEEFKKAHDLAALIRDSVFEPFVTTHHDSASHNKRDIGIIMPGSADFDESNVGYEIINRGSRFIGRAIFNGLSKIQKDRVRAQYSILIVERPHDSTAATKLWVNDATPFGVAAARKHLVGDSSFATPKDLNEANAYIEKLQAKARKYHKSLRQAKFEERGGFDSKTALEL